MTAKIQGVKRKGCWRFGRGDGDIVGAIVTKNKHGKRIDTELELTKVFLKWGN